MANSSLAEAKAQLQAMLGEVRPWAEFVGPVAPPPKWTLPDIQRRLVANTRFFKANYALLVALMSAYYIVTSPGLLLTLLVCLMLYGAVLLTRRKNYVFMNGAVIVTDTVKMGVATVVTVILLGAMGYLFALQWAVSLGGLVCLAHALLRPPVARALLTQRSEADASAGVRGGDIEGGPGGLGLDDPRNMPANANMRLRSRPFGAPAEPLPGAPIGMPKNRCVSPSNFEIGGVQGLCNVYVSTDSCYIHPQAISIVKSAFAALDFSAQAHRSQSACSSEPLTMRTPRASAAGERVAVTLVAGGRPAYIQCLVRPGAVAAAATAVALLPSPQWGCLGGGGAGGAGALARGRGYAADYGGAVA
ncbi:PRA1 family protein-domain-containing protein [Tribonema minus]|uniref:PRA1 family protein-domain-containing protein n=1 Tax=Tribonema minus TaxID=303371 RepID=A0A836CGC4_9STRA|nr:PRA1 family protein-domain-containing protein [Tribonema minus]